jgi:hypothetical protein
MDYKNYLTATIKVPVKFNAEGKLIVLDNYAEISIDPLTNEPKETFDSIYEKMIEYVRKNPEYLTRIVDEGKRLDDQRLDDQRLDDQRLDETLDKPPVDNNPVLHRFPYFKKSKKPLNTSFRNKGTKHNFTKKNYENY